MITAYISTHVDGVLAAAVAEHASIPSGERGGCDDCAANYDDRAAAAEQAQRDRRAREDAFAVKVAELLAAGHSYEEADALLAGWPT